MLKRSAATIPVHAARKRKASTVPLRPPIVVYDSESAPTSDPRPNTAAWPTPELSAAVSPEGVRPPDVSTLAEQPAATISTPARAGASSPERPSSRTTRRWGSLRLALHVVAPLRILMDATGCPPTP